MEEPLDKPRRRCTPYEFFLNVCGEHCQKKGIKKDFSALSSLCWEKWGKMSEMDKKRFVRMSESDQTRLDKEMVIFNEAKKTQSEEKKMGGKQKMKEDEKAVKGKAVEDKKAVKDAEKRRVQEEKKGAKKKKKDPNAPKGPKSSYIMFFTEYREQLKVEQPGISVTEMAKEGGKVWKEMSPSQRSKFEKKAADDKVRFEREKIAYQVSSSSGGQTIPELLRKTAMTPSKSSVVATNGDNDSSSSSESDSDQD